MKGDSKTNTVLLVIIAVLIVVVLFLLRPSGEDNRTSLVGEAKRFAHQLDVNLPGRCLCTFSSQHTRFFSSNFLKNERMEILNNDAHSRTFNQIKSDVIKVTDSLELDLPQALRGVFIIGDDPSAASPVFKGTCSQLGSYRARPEDVTCSSDNLCQEACPQIEGIGDMLLQLEIDCADFITRTFNGIIENQLTQSDLSLFVTRDLDDVSIKGTCQLP